MRRASMVLGLCGGTAGIAAHVILLVRLFGQAEQPLGEVARLGIGILLGVAGIAAALAARRSLRAGALFLPSIGLLGLFPNLLPWAPAAGLMVAGGAVAFVALRRTNSQAPAATAATAAAPAMSPGSPAHWSVTPWAAAGRPGAAPLASRTSEPAAGRGPARREGAWSRRSTGLAAAAVVLLAAIVVSLPVWSPGAAAESSPTGRVASTPSSAPSSPSTSIVPEATTSAEPEPTSTTTTPVAPVDSAAADLDGLVWYSDLDHGFTMAIPASWAEMAWSGLADHDSSPYHVVGFVDGAGPTIAGAYLDGIDVDVVVDQSLDESSLPALAQGLQQSLDAAAAARYDYFQLLEPVHVVMVGNAPGYSATVRVTWQGRVMVKAVYSCIADHRIYSLGFQTDDADWATYQDLFADIIRSFAFGSEATTV